MSEWVIECHSSASKSPWHDYVINELKMTISLEVILEFKYIEGRQCLLLLLIPGMGNRVEFSVLAEGRHIFGRRPKPRAAKRVTIKTWQKPETELEKSLAPRVGWPPGVWPTCRRHDNIELCILARNVLDRNWEVMTSRSPVIALCLDKIISKWQQPDKFLPN